MLQMTAFQYRGLQFLLYQKCAMPSKDNKHIDIDSFIETTIIKSVCSLENNEMGSDLGLKQSETTLALAKRLNVFLVAVILGLILYIREPGFDISAVRNNNAKAKGCAVSFGTYHGNVYNNKKSGTIAAPKCLVESKWMKVQQHTVRLPGNDAVIDDWLWIDYHDRINVLVEAEASIGQKEPTFLVFEQSKYALEGRMSKAIIGGIVEPGENPEDAAMREVEEEMGMHCKKINFLGRYRTDVNRGMGWVNSFLATNCSKKQSGGRSDLANVKGNAEEVGTADTERQDLRTITLTELRNAARAGEFLEVQWSATVALALLRPELNK